MSPLTTRGLRGTYTLWFLAVLNIFLAITATLGNTVILAALSKESFLYPPSKMLLRSLALTDLFVGLFSEPLFDVFLMTVEYENWNGLCHGIITITVISSQVLGSLSLFTPTAISVDRLLALLLGLRYRKVVTFKRVLLVIISFWILSIGFGMAVIVSLDVSLYYNKTAILLCLVVSTCCYTKIYKKLLHQQVQMQVHVHHGQPNGEEPLNKAR